MGRIRNDQGGWLAWGRGGCSPARAELELCETKVMRPSRTPWTNIPIRRRSFTNRPLSLSLLVFEHYLPVTNLLIATLRIEAAAAKQSLAGTSRPMTV